ncbi:MAG: hypothetical protein V4638_11040 [Bacteroidota bacterium]
MKNWVRTLFFVVLLFAMHACGLRYTPAETPEDYQLRRQKAIEAYLKTNLVADSSSYESIAFGQTELIKPASFRLLDSLYEIKLRNDQNHRIDKELEIQIKEQKEKAENEKDLIKYLDYHVFKFGSTDTIQVIATNVLTNKSFTVLEQTIISSLPIPKKYLEKYKQYLFEESFIYPGTSPTYTERYFYTFYKDHAATLVATEKDKFICHTLQLMLEAHKKKSVQTIDLIGQLTKNKILEIAPEIQIQAYGDIYTDEEGNYWLTVDCEFLTKQKVKYYFRFNPYLELLKMQEID